ncbi:hypothetical protein Q5P01_002899 [Channa striata]|uniref:G-protein coupled receptors family 1 profile domain-containing protein n=1 Tax=Channa striata TaxID=64152 RepID=A0AA88NTL1_CHASR|nr:hypothetical protein Q5P01_002899 [Channa striata]
MEANKVRPSAPLTFYPVQTDMSVNSSLHHSFTSCFQSTSTVLISIAVLFTNTFILFPLLFYIFYLGLQRWRKQRFSSASSVMSHSDFFTYNMAALELINILGSCLYSFGVYMNDYNIQMVGCFIFYISSPGQTLFHLFTCVECYLAVVHPITYLGLKQAGAGQIRNITAVCVWLLCIFLSSVVFISFLFLTLTLSTIMGFSLILVSFCCISVLHVLNHPGPGEVSGDKERVDQSKQRAFYTILLIMIAQLFRLAGVLICNVMYVSSAVSEINCVVGTSVVCLAVPCGLVLPLLFLQRAGKLRWCKHKSELG